MADLSVDRLKLQPTAVVEVDFAPLPEPPPQLLRLPGMAEWFRQLVLTRQRDKETIRKLLLTKIVTVILFLLIPSVYGAVPDYTKFKGTGGIIVSSNPPLGDILIDGSHITGGGGSPTNGLTTTNRFFTIYGTNGTTVISNINNGVWIIDASPTTNGLASIPYVISATNTLSGYIDISVNGSSNVLFGLIPSKTSISTNNTILGPLGTWTNLDFYGLARATNTSGHVSIGALENEQRIATLQTTDNTTNTILTITPKDNSAVRVYCNVVGYNSTSSASYTKVGTFKTVAGTVSQVASTATVGSAEDDSAFESIIDTSANTIRVRVAGNTGKTVNWTAFVQIYYTP